MSPALTTQRHQLVASIYDAALDPSRWQDFLAEFVYALNSTTGLIWGHDFSQKTVSIAGAAADLLFSSVGFSHSALQAFHDYYGSVNVWLQDPRMHTAGKVVHDEMLYPNALLKKTEYWTDWLRPQDIFYTAAAVVERSEHRSLNATVCRPQAAGPYSEQELLVIAELMPHLQTGFALHRKFRHLDVLAGATAAVIDQLPFGVVLFDESFALLHHNARAEKLLGDAAAVVRLSAAGIGCVRPRDQQKLQALMQSAVRTGASGRGSAGGSLRLVSATGQMLHLFVAPLPSWSSPFGLRAAIAVFVSRPNDTAGAFSDALRSVYQLTPAECRLTEALVNGLSPKEYGEQASVSINTVRTQIKSAAAKVGVHRQVDLVRTVLLGPAILARAPGRAAPASLR